jgi:hypothetical protein
MKIPLDTVQMVTLGTDPAVPEFFCSRGSALMAGPENQHLEKR